MSYLYPNSDCTCQRDVLSRNAFSPLSRVGTRREGKKDVLVGTDVASKGLDFPAIQHVINFDMPKEIENYVHRIGRTGRCGRTGVATTFINKNSEETVLLDLKALLIEAGQRIPPFLETLDSRGLNLKVCSFRHALW